MNIQEFIKYRDKCVICGKKPALHLSFDVNVGGISFGNIYYAFDLFTGNYYLRGHLSLFKENEFYIEKLYKELPKVLKFNANCPLMWPGLNSYSFNLTCDDRTLSKKYNNWSTHYEVISCAVASFPNVFGTTNWAEPRIFIAEEIATYSGIEITNIHSTDLGNEIMETSVFINDNLTINVPPIPLSNWTFEKDAFAARINTILLLK